MLRKVIPAGKRQITKNKVICLQAFVSLQNPTKLTPKILKSTPNIYFFLSKDEG